MNRYIVVLVLVLSACGTAQTATVNTALTTAQTDLNTVVGFYQTAKGIALVAEATNPALAAKLAPAITAADAVFATAQAALTDATMTAPAIEAIVATLQTQAVAIAQTAAPAVKVISNSAK